MTANTPRSRKSKGRGFQNYIVADIRRITGLCDDDVRSNGMGQPGADVVLSTHGKKTFPYAVECKRTESWNIHEWWRQAERNANLEGLKPLLVLRRNNESARVMMKWGDFLELVQR